jgi:hypothetical protein
VNMPVESAFADDTQVTDGKKRHAAPRGSRILHLHCAANRVAVEAMVQARNEGRDIWKTSSLTSRKSPLPLGAG